MSSLSENVILCYANKQLTEIREIKMQEEGGPVTRQTNTVVTQSLAYL